MLPYQPQFLPVLYRYSKRLAGPLAGRVSTRRRCRRRRSRRSRHCGLLAAVAFEDPRRRELAELVTDHVFLHEHLDELVPVVDLERVPDELRDDRARPTPGLERLLGAALVEHPHAVEQLLIDERAFFC